MAEERKAEKLWVGRTRSRAYQSAHSGKMPRGDHRVLFCRATVKVDDVPEESPSKRLTRSV